LILGGRVLVGAGSGEYAPDGTAPARRALELGHADGQQQREAVEQITTTVPRCCTGRP
jgi:hypothetical protein